MSRTSASWSEACALPRIDTILKLTAGANVSPCELLEGMEWRPGRQVDGDFYLTTPGAMQSVRRTVIRG